jgi:FMN phosphatase YigB (HAD superfamily)
MRNPNYLATMPRAGGNAELFSGVPNPTATNMALSLEQYARFLDTRDLNWPVPPAPTHVKAKPHLSELPHIRLVTWNIYGTLLTLTGGELYFQHPQKMIMDVALEKTVQEFKMWGSMSRKPGQPSEYMGQIYDGLLAAQRLAPSPGEKYPEILADRIWEAVLGKLAQKEYQYDEKLYGSISEYSRKIAYFFHSCLQGTACHPGVADAMEHLHACGLKQGLIADGQCFTLLQLQRALEQQYCASPLNQLIDPELCALSFAQRARKPSERLFRTVLQAAAGRGIVPAQILHVGTRIVEDLAPAKKLGMRTCLFAGDGESLHATRAQVKDSATRPDVLLTKFEQIREVVPGVG